MSGEADLPEAGDEIARFLHDLFAAGGTYRIRTAGDFTAPARLALAVTRADGVDVELHVSAFISQGEPLLAVRRFEIRTEAEREAQLRWALKQRHRRG